MKKLSWYQQEQHDKAQARARKIVAMRNRRMTWPEIGAKFNITPQRAQQLYAAATALRNVE